MLETEGRTRSKSSVDGALQRCIENGHTTVSIARAIGVWPQTVERWFRGEQRLTSQNVVRLRMLASQNYTSVRTGRWVPDELAATFFARAGTLARAAKVLGVSIGTTSAYRRKLISVPRKHEPAMRAFLGVGARDSVGHDPRSDWELLCTAVKTAGRIKRLAPYLGWSTRTLSKYLAGQRTLPAHIRDRLCHGLESGELLELNPSRSSKTDPCPFPAL